MQDLNGANATGFMIAQMHTKNGVRYSTAKAFIRPAASRSNLHVMLNTTVAKVLINPSTKQVIGVETIDKDGHTAKILASKEVIVSGGAVNSPQILMLSGVGPKEELENVGIRTIHDLPGVGKNIHNHVGFMLSFLINDTDTAPLNWATAMEYLLFRDGLMSGTGLSDVTAKISSRFAENPNAPDIQFFFGGFLANCAKTGQVGELLSNGSRIISIFPVAVAPKSRGYITLASADPLAPPKIFANYLDEQHDVDVLIEATKFALRLSETGALQAYGMQLIRTPATGCESFAFGSDDYWECAIRHKTEAENHQAGSCKMGPMRDPMAVVDHELRVI